MMSRYDGNHSFIQNKEQGLAAQMQGMRLKKQPLLADEE
jgi:hypothetical protein